MPGTVLLLAASPVGRGCLVDAASVLPVLAAVPPAVLSGTDTANVVELADPLEPQAVLTRLRRRGAAPGPLTVYVAGQLSWTGASACRTWRWPVRHRRPSATPPCPGTGSARSCGCARSGATTLLLDLHADQETWQWLRASPLDCGRNNAVYGRIAPPPARRTVAAPSHMRAVATILRSGHRPPPDQLHQQALTRAARRCRGQWRGGRRGPGADRAGAGGGRPARRHRRRRAVRAARGRRRSPPGTSGPPLTPTGPPPRTRCTGRRSAPTLRCSRGPGAGSCRAWLTVAEARLGAGQRPQAPAVEAAVDRAHHQWGQVRDAGPARELGGALAALRGRVPGRREGALDHVRRELSRLQVQG